MPRLSDVCFTFSPSAGESEFEVVHFTLDEALSESFCLRLALSSLDPAVDFGALLDHPALFTIWRGDAPVRYVHGIVTRFEQCETGFRRTRYRAVAAPPVLPHAHPAPFRWQPASLSTRLPIRINKSQRGEMLLQAPTQSVRVQAKQRVDISASKQSVTTSAKKSIMLLCGGAFRALQARFDQ